MRCGRAFVSCEPGEKNLPYVAEWLGADHNQLKRKIFCENPQRLYGCTVDPADFKA
jgi:hypothetical protein